MDVLVGTTSFVKPTLSQINNNNNNNNQMEGSTGWASPSLPQRALKAVGVSAEDASGSNLGPQSLCHNPLRGRKEGRKEGRSVGG